MSDVKLKKFHELYATDSPIRKVVLCETKELAQAFLKEAHELGYTWVSGDNLLSFDNWSNYKSETCYLIIAKDPSKTTFRGIMFGQLERYKKGGYKIVNYKLSRKESKNV